MVLEESKESEIVGVNLLAEHYLPAKAEKEKPQQEEAPAKALPDPKKKNKNKSAQLHRDHQAF